MAPSRARMKKTTRGTTQTTRSESDPYPAPLNTFGVHATTRYGSAQRVERGATYAFLAGSYILLFAAASEPPDLPAHKILAATD